MNTQDIKKRVYDNRQNIIQFLRDICAIPSMEGQLKEVEAHRRRDDKAGV